MFGLPGCVKTFLLVRVFCQLIEDDALIFLMGQTNVTILSDLVEIVGASDQQLLCNSRILSIMRPSSKMVLVAGAAAVVKSHSLPMHISIHDGDQSMVISSRTLLSLLLLGV